MLMKKTIPLCSLLAAAVFFVNGCIVINVERKESGEEAESQKAIKEITVESH